MIPLRLVGAMACLGLLAAGACGRSGGPAPSQPAPVPAGAASGRRAEKRAGPPRVPPVLVGGLRIEALHWGKERGLGQNGGYIVARDTATGRELWILKVYDVRYRPGKEPDAQDTFIARMVATPSGDGLEITDERGRRYAVDLKSRKVHPL